MNWDAIGALGEIVGALAVVVTLFFLAVQIRASNALASADSRDRTFEQMSRLRHLIASDAELARIWMRGCLGEPLADEEDLRFTEVAHDHFMVWRSAFQRSELAGRQSMVPVRALVRTLQDPAKPALEHKWRQFIAGSGFEEDPFVQKVNLGLSEPAP